MDNKSTTKRMIGAVVLVLIAALLLAWLLKGKNQSVQEQQELIADQAQEASPILGFPGVNESEEGGDGQVAQNTDGQANENGEATQDGSGSYVIGAADQASQTANEAQQQAKNALAASGAAASGAANQAVGAVKQAGQDVANATGFQVRDSQGQEGAEQRPIVEGGEVKTGTGSMGGSDVATNNQGQQTGDAANNTQAAPASGTATQQVAGATDSGGTQQASQQVSGTNAGAANDAGTSQSSKKVANPKLVNEKPVPAPKIQSAARKPSGNSGTAKSAGKTESASATSSAAKKAPSSGSGGQVADGGYAIQVLAASSRSKAENVKKDIARDGYPAFVVRANVNGKTVYRVRVGTYPGKGAARAVQKRMKARYTKNQFVQNSFVTRN